VDLSKGGGWRCESPGSSVWGCWAVRPLLEHLSQLWGSIAGRGQQLQLATGISGERVGKIRWRLEGFCGQRKGLLVACLARDIERSQSGLRLCEVILSHGKTTVHLFDGCSSSLSHFDMVAYMVAHMVTHLDPHSCHTAIEIVHREQGSGGAFLLTVHLDSS
jgi:hypothetical protein